MRPIDVVFFDTVLSSDDPFEMCLKWLAVDVQEFNPLFPLNCFIICPTYYEVGFYIFKTDETVYAWSLYIRMDVVKEKNSALKYASL